MAFDVGVLVLLAMRIVAKFLGVQPQAVAGTPAWQKFAANLMHVALYVFMIAMPLLGWLILSAQGEVIPYFGINLPPLIGKSESVAKWAKEIHEVGGTLGYVLVGLHTLAALYHHYVVRDNCLRRMLPWCEK